MGKKSLRGLSFGSLVLHQSPINRPSLIFNPQPSSRERPTRPRTSQGSLWMKALRVCCAEKVWRTYRS